MKNFTFSINNLQRFRFFTIVIGLFMANSGIQAQKFTDVSIDAGIDFLIAEDRMGGGVTVFDYDNDGWEDLYVSCQRDQDHLFRNNGDGTFEDVTALAGFSNTSSPFHTMGVVAGDIDNDGFRDLFIVVDNSHSHDLLYRNNGNGTFTDISEFAGLLKDSSNGSSAAMADFNNDGYLDIYVVNRIDTSGLILDSAGIPIAYDHICKANNIYINNGDFTFSEMTDQYGVGDNGCANVVSVTDFDNDHDMDIIVGNDFGGDIIPNALLRNDYPLEQFTDISKSANAGQRMFTMGIAIGDYDHDLDLDYYITNMGRNTFLSNNGDETFDDIADISGTADKWLDPVEGTVVTGWGAAFLDVDNDTWQDLYVVNGYVGIPFPNPAPNRVKDPNKFFYNNGNGTFTERAAELGIDHDKNRPRGLAYLDYNNDGDMDMFVTVLDVRTDREEHCLLYRNDLVNNNNFLKVKLEGVESNRDAIGAHITIYLGNESWMYEIDGGSSWMAQNTSIAHFGLGQSTMVDSLVIDWPSGIRQKVENIAANQYVKITENEPVGITEVMDVVSNWKVYPNPFESQTTIEYHLDVAKYIQITIFDALGREVEQLVNGIQTSGTHLVQFDGSQLHSGVYILKLTIDDSNYSERIIVR